MYEDWREEFEQFSKRFDKKKWSRIYYRRKKDSILKKQREYTRTNRDKILARRRQQYSLNRKSTKPYKSQPKRDKEREQRLARIAELEKQTQEIIQRLIEHQKQYNIWKQKDKVLLDEMRKVTNE